MRNFTKLMGILLVIIFPVVTILAQSNASSGKALKPVTGKTAPAVVIQQGTSMGKAPSAQQLIQQRLENSVPAVFDKKKKSNKATDSFCGPTYTNGCMYGDGFTDFAVEQIQNYGTGCADLNGIGWSEYYNLGPAILMPGFSYTFTMATGFPNQYVNIWIDYNDDETLTPDEIILVDFYLANSGEMYTTDVVIPANAVPGQHAMRAMMVYASLFTDPCGAYSYGEAEDYSVIIGVPAYGTVEGYVTENTGGAPVADAFISINNGMFTATSGVNGYFEFPSILTGTWTANCTKVGYNPASAPVTVIENQTSTLNFALTVPTMDITPDEIDIVIDIESTATEYIDIANNGDGQLGWSGQLQLIDGDNSAVKGSIAYANDLNNYTIVSFDVDDPATPTNIGPTSYQFFGGDFDSYNTGFFWAIDHNTNALYTVDIVTGFATFVAPLTGMTSGQSISGMACDKSTGIMYVSSTSVSASDIYTIDLTTGALTLVGTTGIPGLIEIAIDGTGTMYGWDIVNDQSFIIDKFTGASTLLGPLGYDLNYAQGGNWDPASDIIYLAAYDFSGQLMTLDKTTGALTYIGPFQNGAELDCLAFPGSADNWISISPSSGTVSPGNSDQMTVEFNSEDIIPGTIKHANINFSSNPAVGTVTVPVTMKVGALDWGYITGNISLTGTSPYNFGNVEEVLVEAGPYYTNPDATGYYEITAYPGTYDVTATLYGYTQGTIPAVVVGEGLTVTGQDMAMPCIMGRVMGTVYDEPSGLPLPDATVKIEGTDIMGITLADGTYEIFAEAGTYDITAFDATHTPLTEPDVVINVEADTPLDFYLQPGLATVYPQALDYWTGTCTPTDKTQISYIKAWGSEAQDGEQGWMKFDISAIPAGSVILQVTLHGYVTNTNYPYWSITPMPLDPVTAAASEIWSTASAGSTPEVSYAYLNESSTFAPGWKEYVLGNSIIPDFTAAMPQGWFAVGIFERDWSSTYYIEFDGWNEPNVPYLVVNFFIPSFGTLTGTVTELSTGNPLAGANITAVGPYNTYTFTTGADGTYLFDPCQVGTYNITCSKDGYNIQTATVEVMEAEITTQDFILTAPQIVVSPLTVTVELDPGDQEDETVNISNPGNGPLNWGAAIDVLDDNGNAGQKGSMAYALQVYPDPVAVVSFDTDVPSSFNTIASSTLDAFAGDFSTQDNTTLYVITYSTTTLYSIDITTGEQTMIAPVSGITPGQSITGMACDKTTGIMYVSTTDITNSDLYTLDLATGVLTLIGTTGIPGVIEIAIDGTGTLYAWDILLDEAFTVDKNTATSTLLGPLGFDLNYAQGGNWDPESDIIYLAAYTFAGQLMTMDKTTGALTLIGDFPGGAEVDCLAFPGGYSTWLTIDPKNGMIEGGNDQTMNLHFDATDMIPGYYYANINFSTTPDVGSPQVQVTMHVTGLIPAINLTVDHSCTDVELTWEVASGGTPDSYNIYRDGALLGNSTEMHHTDEMVMPMVEYEYYVKAVYGGVESMATNTVQITVPMPTQLQPIGLDATPDMPGENDVTLEWNAPNACLSPDGYNVLRDDAQINAELVTDLTYVDEMLGIGLWKYNVTAVYYFGESNPSSATYVLITSVPETSNEGLMIYPNPASGNLFIQSDITIERMQFINNTGQVVIDREPNANLEKIDLTEFESGLYIIKLRINGTDVLHKITVR